MDCGDMCFNSEAADVSDDREITEHLHQALRVRNGRAKRTLQRKSRFQRDKPISGSSTLFLIDYEDLAGPNVGVESAQQAISDLFKVVPYQSNAQSVDHVVMAYSKQFAEEKTAALEGKRWPVTPITRVTDVVQEELLNELGILDGFEVENDLEISVNKLLRRNAASYDRIVICSGNDAFEMAAIVYQSIGMEVAVVSRLEALSYKLAAAATEVLLIPSMDDRKEILRLNRQLGFGPK
jgi:hypothetical protein